MNKNFKYCFIIISLFFIPYSNLEKSYANEPMIEYKYSVEKYKIDRAKFIWEAALNEMIMHKTISKEEKSNVKKYVNSNINKRTIKETQYDTERKALKIDNVDMLVLNKIINKEQGEELKFRLNKYDLNNLE